MCGIAGEVSWRSGADAAGVGRLVACLSHRARDDSGIWTSPRGHCALGHARLSVIDLSASGHQPMRDPITGNTIGEIYNFAPLRARCEALGDRFASRSDTEVILALYRRHGTDCLPMLRGMFAFAVWDAREQRLFMARDRVGKKPFNYALSEHGLVFSSELDPLSSYNGVSAEIDLDALELYLQLQYIPPPYSIYKGITKLPPAHFAIYDRTGFRTQPYWDLYYQPDETITLGRAADELEERLTEAVKIRLVSDVPVGALLSGGVDSSLVVALMAKLNQSPVETFSIGFDQEEFSELPYAEQVARRFSTNYHPQVVRGDVSDMLPLIAKRYGEPFADSSAVPSFFVSKAARSGVTVALNGDGGDELLGGYPRYSLRKGALLTSMLLGRALSSALSTALVPWATRARGLPSRVARRLLLDYAKPEMRSLLMYGSYWSDDARAELLEGHHNTQLLPRWREFWLSEATAHATNPVDRMLWMDNRTYLPGDLLVKMDIAAMHCGLEMRSPLLDHQVIEYCATLPPRLKVDCARGKYLLKYIAERHFPPEFVHRRKMGFGILVGAWLGGPLRAVVHDVLSDRNAMAPFAPAVISATLQRLESSDEDAHRVWSLLMYGMWYRTRFGVRRS